MEWLVLVLVVAALAGGVVWNHRTAAEAREGVEFYVDAPPGAVAEAVRTCYCAGAKATLKSVLSRMTVQQAGAHSFTAQSSIGDSGAIDVAPQGDGSVVRAWTTSLYVGAPPATRGRSGIYGLASAITHGIYVALGLTPNAGKMKRFQRAVERKVAAQLRKAVA